MKTLKRQSFANIYFLIVVCIFLFCAACGGVTGGFATDAEIPTGTESDLYEGGPVEIPVTIAKLDAPDASKIVVTVDDLSANSINTLPKNAIKQAVEIVDDCSLIYTVVGEPDAVTDADATHVGIFNLSIDTGTVYHLYSVAEVESDGSFEGQICGNFQDQVVIVALDSDDLASANASSPLILTVEEDAENQLTIIITDTNAAAIETNFNVLTDGNGNAYYVLVNDDGTSDFYRRNIDGSSLETIWQDETDIPTALGAYNDNLVIYFNQNGALKQVELPDTSASITAKFLNGGAPTQILFATISSVSGYNTGLDPYEVDGFRVDVTYDPGREAPDNSGMIVVQFPDPGEGALDGITGAVFNLGSDSDALDEAFAQIGTMGGESALGDYQAGRGYFVLIDDSIYGCEGSGQHNGCLIRIAINDAAEEFEIDNITDVGLFYVPEEITQVDVHPVDYDASVLMGPDGVYYFHDTGHFFGAALDDELEIPATTGEIDLHDVDEDDDGVDDRLADKWMVLDESADIKRVQWSRRGRLLLGCKLYSDGIYSLVCYDPNTESFVDLVPAQLRERDSCVPTADITTNSDNDVHIWWDDQHSMVFYDENPVLQSCFLRDYDEYITDVLQNDSSDENSVEDVFNFCTEYEATDSFSHWDDFCSCYGPFASSTEDDCQQHWDDNCNDTGNNTNLGDCVEYMMDLN